MALLARQQGDTQPPAGNQKTDLLHCEAAVIPYDGTDLSALEELSADMINGGGLRLLGSEHTRNANHPQFQRIENVFTGFEPDVAYFEGPDRGVRETLEETILETGEGGFIRMLAKVRGVPAASLEPNPMDEFVYVLEEFSIEQASLFYLLRAAAQWREREGLDDEAMTARMNEFLARANGLFENLPAPYSDFTILNADELAALYAKYWTEPSDWRDAPLYWFSPEQKSEDTGGIFTNEVNARSSHYRNLSVYRLFAAHAASGEKAFGLMGGDHLPRLKPTFECLEAQ